MTPDMQAEGLRRGWAGPAAPKSMKGNSHSQVWTARASTDLASYGSQVALVAILLLGFALRLHRLGIESLWLDEMGQASMAAGGVQHAVAGARLHHGAAPLDYLLTWLALLVAHAEFVVRLPAAMVGTLTLALCYRLGWEVFGRATGLLAALLLAVAPLHLRFSQEARFYALFAALVVASALALLIALRRNDRIGWAAYGLVLVAGLYSHYYMPLVVLAQGLAVLVAHLQAGKPNPGIRGGPGVLWGFLLSCLLAALAYLPWVLYAVVRETGTPLATPPVLSWSYLHTILVGLVLGEDSPPSLPALTWLYGVLAGLGAVVGVARRGTRIGALLILLPLLLGPPLIVLVLRQVGYFFALRQVVFLLPFLLLLVAQGGVTLVGWLARAVGSSRRAWMVRAGAGAVLVVMLVWPLWPVDRALYAMRRQNWRDTLAFVQANAGSEDAILVPRVPGHYFGYYAPQWSQEPDRVANPASLSEAQALAERSPASWVLVISQAGELGEKVRGWLQPPQALRLDFGPQITVYYWRPGYTEEDLLAEVLQWTPPRDTRALEQLVYKYSRAGMPEAAASAARQGAALAQTPEEASYFEMLQGSVWRDQGQNERAIQAFWQALALWPDNVEALIRLGERLLAEQRRQEAETQLARAVDLAPGSYWAQRLLAEAYLQLSRPTEAVVGFQAAIAIDPDEPETYFRLGDALADAGDWKAAAIAYRQYLTLAPGGRWAAEVQQRLTELEY